MKKCHVERKGLLWPFKRAVENMRDAGVLTVEPDAKRGRWYALGGDDAQ